VDKPPARIRVNDMIRAPKVRLVGPDGKLIDVVTGAEALRRARSVGLDLVEVAPLADPPVCKIVSFSKWRYEQDQKNRARKPRVESKEFTFTVVIGAEDLRVKCRKVAEALTSGHRVALTVRLRGRETSRPEAAVALIEKIAHTVADVGVLTQAPATRGRQVKALLTPAAARSARGGATDSG
jgi:translation initiation factor IF-3